MMNADGIAFLNKTTLKGFQVYVKFYNHADTSYLISLAHISDSNRLYAHFSGGIIALIEASDGTIFRAVKVSN